jgi:hypothetical protein
MSLSSAEVRKGEALVPGDLDDRMSFCTWAGVKYSGCRGAKKLISAEQGRV